jgi:hypothetical protein
MVITILLFTSSCDLFGPTVVCDKSNLGPAMTCAGVVAAAQGQLAQVDGITLLTVVRGLPCDVDSLACPPDVPAGIVSTVYADIADGRRIAVPVYAEDDGSLRAGPLQEMSPSP